MQDAKACALQCSFCAILDPQTQTPSSHSLFDSQLKLLQSNAWVVQWGVGDVSGAAVMASCHCCHLWTDIRYAMMHLAQSWTCQDAQPQASHQACGAGGEHNS